MIQAACLHGIRNIEIVWNQYSRFKALLILTFDVRNNVHWRHLYTTNYKLQFRVLEYVDLTSTITTTSQTATFS